MKKYIILSFILILFSSLSFSQKQRVLVLSDIENEPDDAESLVRFLSYSNMWDVEGIIATTSTHMKNKIADYRMHEIVAAYGKVRNNLILHEKGFPTEDYLHGILKKGLPVFGMEGVGKDKDSEGSDWIISVVDKADNRPLWITVWGGPNCLAQALWKVSRTRSAAELEKFVAKLRVYAISDQDDTGSWIRKTFPNLFYIVSPGYYDYSTWAGISGEKMGQFSGPDSNLVSNEWLLENVRTNHGALGAEYPEWKFIMEGDSPSFLYLIDNGLGSPENPNYGSWGGRYDLYIPRYRNFYSETETRPIWTNTEDKVKGVDGNFYFSDKATVWRWRSAYQNDFAARMDWCVKPFNEANHPPIAKITHSDLITVKSGETVYLDASNSSDPDKNKLQFEWMYYQEVGTYMNWGPIEINNKNAAKASFTAPNVTKPETIHIVLILTDDGVPALTRYKRVIITVLPTL